MPVGRVGVGDFSKTAYLQIKIFLVSNFVEKKAFKFRRTTLLLTKFVINIFFKDICLGECGCWDGKKKEKKMKGWEGVDEKSSKSSIFRGKKFFSALWFFCNFHFVFVFLKFQGLFYFFYFFIFIYLFIFFFS